MNACPYRVIVKDRAEVVTDTAYFPTRDDAEHHHRTIIAPRVETQLRRSDTWHTLTGTVRPDHIGPAVIQAARGREASGDA